MDDLWMDWIFNSIAIVIFGIALIWALSRSLNKSAKEL